MKFSIKKNPHTRAIIFFILISVVILIISCNSSPKVIEQVQPTTPEAQPQINSSTSEEESHMVIVREVLQGERYTYLNVNEKGRKYWLAVAKQDIKVGDKIVYKAGLMKKNFESKEFNRVFETIYLVSKVRRGQEAVESTSTLDKVYSELQKKDNSARNIQTNTSGLQISLIDLLKSPSKYANKTISVKGECVKVNNQIMGKNWVHIQENSNSPETDLILTTTEIIEIGTKATFTGTISINKDFGAGYKYAIIMENTRIQ